jgi:hypothetical protein
MQQLEQQEGAVQREHQTCKGYSRPSEAVMMQIPSKLLLLLLLPPQQEQQRLKRWQPQQQLLLGMLKPPQALAMMGLRRMIK